MRQKITAVVLPLLLVSGGRAAAQTIDAGPVEIGFGGRAQIQFNTTSVDEEDLALAGVVREIPFSTFVTRRVRLTVSVEIEDWITGRIQPDFALGELSLKDAWLNFAFEDAFEVRAGQFKKPFSAIELTSTTKYLAIEKGARIRGLPLALAAAEDGAIPGGLPRLFPFQRIPGEEQALLDRLGYLGRDLGVAVHGTVDRAAYAIGAFNGGGADTRDNAGGKSFAARVELRPAEALPLTLGASASYHETRVRLPVIDTGVIALGVNFANLDGFAFEADFEWGDFRRAGPHLLVEGSIGKNFLASLVCARQPTLPPLPGNICVISPTPANDSDFLGAQGILAWFQPLDDNRIEGIEPLARISYGDPNTDREDDEGWLITPGANLYFFGRNRFMANWDVFVSANEELETQHSLRVQVNLHF